MFYKRQEQNSIVQVKAKFEGTQGVVRRCNSKDREQSDHNK